MTFYYQTSSWNSQPQITEEAKKLWEHVVQKKNWRIVQLPNGFYQTEYLDPKKQMKVKTVQTEADKLRRGSTLDSIPQVPF